MSGPAPKGNGTGERGSDSGHNSGTAKLEPLEGKGRLDRARVTLSSARPPKAPTPPRRLYDLAAVGCYLGMPVYSVREMLWRGDVPYVRIGRRQYVDLRDLDAFIEQAKVRER